MVVFLHGNAELIDHQYAIVDLYHAQGISVLLPEFRGYGHSAGSPSQAHIVADVVAFYDLAIALPQVDAQRIVIHGRSIGGGVAAQLADQRACNALIVESTGASVAAMAWRYGIPPFIVRSPFHSARVFRGLDVPVLIMHGQDDEVFRTSTRVTCSPLRQTGRWFRLRVGTTSCRRQQKQRSTIRPWRTTCRRRA